MPSVDVKNAWSDKFSLPVVEELRALQPKPLQGVFQRCRQRLTELDLAEHLQWQGVPWRWTIVYSTPDAKAAPEPVPHFQPSAQGSGPTPRAFAYLIPDPSRLQICVPLTGLQIERLPMKKLKKPIRDGVALARSVGGIWWPTWEIASMSAFDDVFELVRKKHELCTGPAVTTGA